MHPEIAVRKRRPRREIQQLVAEYANSGMDASEFCDYLRHSNLHVTNQYLQATSKSKRLAQDKLVDGSTPSCRVECCREENQLSSNNKSL
jgi:hypothetical protein